MSNDNCVTDIEQELRETTDKSTAVMVEQQLLCPEMEADIICNLTAKCLTHKCQINRIRHECVLHNFLSLEA